LNHTNYIESKKLSPILKWAGGKEQELKYIIPKLPPSFNNYYEPFVGGGAVYTAIQAQKYFINDKSNELIALYRNITDENRTLLFEALDKIVNNWDILTAIIEQNDVYFIAIYKKYANNSIDETVLKSIVSAFTANNLAQFNAMFSDIFDFNTENFIKEIKINLIRKIKRMKVLEQEKHSLADTDILSNIETALKSAFYMQFRYLHNNCEKYEIKTALCSAIFLFIRNFAYSGMFRYNSNGDFNVPYGGIGYNRKNFLKKIDYLRSAELKSLLETTTIENLDFQDFLSLHEPKKDDFIFLDPPYDSEFSTYAKNEFSKNDQQRLADFLIKKCEAQWMMIIKNTDFIFHLYDNKGLNIQSFDKTYLVSFMNRNDKNVEHLLITNY
jgi:DNA adenine methylase